MSGLKSLIFAKLSRVSAWQIVFLAVISISFFLLYLALNRPTPSNVAIFGKDPHSPRLVDLQTFTDTVSQVQMNKTDERIMYSLLHAFHLLMTSHKIVYVGYAGTILGAARHAAIIPWDDDADFVVMKRDTPSLFRAIASQDTLKLCYMNDDFYKITFRNTSLAKDTNKYCGWPNLDLLMAHDMGSQLKVNFMGSFIFDKASFYPAVVVPFGPLHLSFPRCFHQIAVQDIGLDTCCTGSWNHRVEEWAPRPACINCTELRSYFPFATFTKQTEESSKMILRVNGKVIRQETVEMPHCDVVHVQFIKPKSFKPLVDF